MSIERTDTENRQRVALAAGVALLAAGLIFVAFILPAEFAVDPLGTGRMTGLLDLGTTGQEVAALEASAGSTTGAAAQAIVATQDRPFHDETVTFAIEPGAGMEYKYRLDKGEALLYSWSATGLVNVEFHAEPDGAPRGYAQSYVKSSGLDDAGTLTAPFSGIHGWYWENTTDAPITVTLSAAGFYSMSHEFRTGEPVKNKPFP